MDQGLKVIIVGGVLLLVSLFGTISYSNYADRRTRLEIARMDNEARNIRYAECIKYNEKAIEKQTDSYRSGTISC